MSKVLPILFNTDMVRAILNGRKTVTRRKIKFPKNRFTGEIPKADSVKVYKNTLLSEKINFYEEPYYSFNVKAPCQRGDILYVREPWGDYRECTDVGCGYFMYRADYPERATTYEHDNITCDLPKWHPSIHMPKEAARIWLKVKDVRAERLQDMTLNDFLAEGAYLNPEAFNDPENAYGQAKRLFTGIWNSTIKKSDQDLYEWDANPWVWVIEFEKCEKPAEN